MNENLEIRSLTSFVSSVDHTLSLVDGTTDFSEFLNTLGAEPTHSNFYWQVGQISKTQGWILHLSVIRTQLTQLFNLVVPILLKENIPFKIVRTRLIADNLLSGDYGPQYLAKIMCIYPENDEAALALAQQLISLTKDFKGPAIPTDLCLGNIIYTRYGSFSPVQIKNQRGELINHIYNDTGELIPDPYTIPFAYPVSARWPFYSLAAPVLPKKFKLLNGRYYPISTIKSDYRGTVLKAIYFRRPWDIKACVIKEGVMNMGSDNNGRDAADRLHWQFTLCERLKEAIPLPRIFDCFVEHGNTYLAMGFINGQSLGKWGSDLHNYRPWFDLEAALQEKILTALFQVVDIVRRMHENGYVHRDITPTNFIIEKGKKVVPIDLELAWSFLDNPTSSPFLLGTPGYMSPQQRTGIDTPSVKDDIYALGAFIMELCSGLNPVTLSSPSHERLIESLIFFTKNTRLSKLIADCLDNDPFKRPALDTIQKTLLLCSKPHAYEEVSPAISEVDLRNLTQAALNRIANPKMLDSNFCWISNRNEENSAEQKKETQDFERYIGWHTGMSGPLWLVAIAKLAGFNVEDCMHAYNQSWNYVHSNHVNTPSHSNSSLYYGGGGIAIALTEGLKAELLSPTTEILQQLKSCFSKADSGYTLASGAAGQGIALLHAYPWLEEHFARELLELCVKFLTSSQHPSGSWGSTDLTLNTGISGITWFLLGYIKYSSDYSVEPFIRKALHWITSNKQNRNSWKKINDSQNQSWASGQTAADVTLLFLRSYEVLGDIKYKEIAQRNLDMIPDHIITNNLTFNNGIAKIGELYLEAYSVLKDHIWLDKATWITNSLFHIAIEKNKTEAYWPIHYRVTTPADLFEGVGGIIHYLMRYFSRTEIPHILS